MINVHPKVEQALRTGRPVVALESALITVGMPRTPLGRRPDCETPGWDARQPTNLEVARLLERIVREAGAIPATVAVIDGRLRIGLDEVSLRRLAEDPEASKASAGDLSYVMGRGRTAGATVSATMLACQRPEAGPIHVLATGGIGGLHRGWITSLDISADLHQLATTAVCVVASGAKVILDVPSTMEALKTLGVPVITLSTDRCPQFYCGVTDELRTTGRLNDAAAVAELCRTHWQKLGCPGGVLVANPIPQSHALNHGEIDRIAEEAEAEAQSRGITGPARTPYLLRAVVEQTGGRALDANIALLADNARVAARVAEALVGTDAPRGRPGARHPPPVG